MPDYNITYHQTAAQKARRTRNDSAAVAGLGLGGLAATSDKPGLANPHMKRLARGTRRAVKAKRVSALGGAKILAHGIKDTVHLGRGLSEAAIGAGAAGVAGGEARNIYHTHKEQKLRRQRIRKSAFLEEVSKMKQNKMTYCKRHGKFDDCADQVSKARDDGINHLTGTSRMARSSEDRGCGMLVPLEIGRRQMDGTPMTGTDSSLSDKINPGAKAGSSTGSKAVMGSGIREQVPGGPKKRVSKAQNKLNSENWSPGRAVTTTAFAGPHGLLMGKKGKKLRAAGNEVGGAVAGGLGGQLAGGAVGLLGGREGARIGSGLGGFGGSVAGGVMGGRRSAKKGYYRNIAKAAGGAHDAFLGDEVSKADSNTHVRASGVARYGLGPVFTGKQGKKAAAIGVAYKHALPNQIAGAGSGAILGAALGASKHQAGLGAAIGGLAGLEAGGVRGAKHGADANARAGNLKPKYVVQRGY